MNLEKYQELTGITVTTDDIPKINAQIRRTRIILESLLGYSLVKKTASENQYAEKGQVVNSFLFDIGQFNLDGPLNPPDDVIGSFRIYSYNRIDEFIHTDPFVKLNSVKLVLLKQGEEPNGVTVRKFLDDEVAVKKTFGIQKYITILWKWYRNAYLFNQCPSYYQPQVAIDADWLNETCLPEEILFIWADMVTFYADDKNNIERETLGPHSYQKFKREKPEELPESLKIIQNYAGPNSSIVNVITV